MSTLNEDEVKHFEALASQWWDVNGAFAPLHRLTPLRLDYIIEHIGAVKGKKILDVGCGGGLLAEPLCRLGAHVTAIDASDESIKAAKSHSGHLGLDIDYQNILIENLKERDFDFILAMEVIEHVNHGDEFIQACANHLKAGGKIILSTINRTALAFITAIIGGEYILRLLPIGTHHFEQFVRPDELSTFCAHADMDIVHQQGVGYNPLRQSFFYTSSLEVNYMMVGQKREKS